MRTESRFIRDIIGDVLCVFPCDDRVIQQVIIKILRRIFKVKLDQLNPIAKSVERHFDPLSNSNELFITCIENR